MNKKLLIISFAVLALFAKQAIAQEAQEYAKNVVKLNLFGLGASNISLQYERALHKNISVALQAGFIPSHGLPSQISSAVPSDVSSIKISGFNISPEFRWYPGKKVAKQAPRGFYIAPYLRYSSYTAAGSFTYDDSTFYPAFIQKKVASMSITYAGFGFGGMIGYQWVINNKISIDWWIVGGHGGSSKITARVDAENAGQNDDIRKGLEEMDVNGATKTITMSGNTVKLEVAGLPFAGMRTGLCIGIAF